MQTEMNVLPVTFQGVEPILLCPICGGTYVHPVAVACHPAGSPGGEVVVRANGVYLNPSNGIPGERGVRITLQFWCEEGHAFTYAFQFHKGQTFLEQRSQIPALSEPVIWRS